MNRMTTLLLSMSLLCAACSAQQESSDLYDKADTTGILQESIAALMWVGRHQAV